MGQRVFATTCEQGESEGESEGSADNGGWLWLGAACGEGEREANGAGECVGQALAFFWSADARRGGVSTACTPRGDPLLSRSAMATLTIF